MKINVFFCIIIFFWKVFKLLKKLKEKNLNLQVCSRMSSFINLENYTLINKIGEGSFGVVFKVKEKDTDNYYAAKITKKEISDEQNDQRQELYLEINLMAKFNHPSILQFIGYSPIDFQGSPNPTIITHLAINGTLRDIISLESKGQAPDSWDFTKKLINIYGIAIGMQYLHKNNIIHRDLKPENIFMDESYCPKIADFGLSKPTSSIGMSMIFQSNGAQKGTYAYLPPELILEKTSASTKEGDVYAFSFVVYEMLTTNEPYQSFNDIFKKINRGERPEIPSYIPDPYRNLIDRCWSEEPENRPTFDDIVEELTTNNDFITDLVNEGEFIDYTLYIEETKSTFNENSQKFHFNDFIKKRKQSMVSLFPQLLFEELSGPCQELIREAEKSGRKQFLVGKDLIEGNPPFQQNTQLGIKYLTKSIESGVNEATFYYCGMLIEGNLIPEDLELSRSLLSNIDEPEASVLLGKIEYKEKNFEKAKDYFIEASKKGNGESMYLYASMLMKGGGVEVNHDEALKFFTLAIKNGYDKEPLQISVIPPQQQTTPQEPNKPEKVKKERKKSLKKKDQQVHELKFVVVGDAIENCKTAFLMTLNHRPFPDRYVPTIYENYKEEVEFEGKRYSIWIWDTAGTDEYARIRPLSYSGANIVGITFPMSSRSSFIDIREKWIGEVLHYCKDAAIVLIGLCLDEVEEGNPNHVTVKEAKAFAHDNEFDGFLACSAKTGEGMDEVFPTLIRALKSKHKDELSCNIA